MVKIRFDRVSDSSSDFKIPVQKLCKFSLGHNLVTPSGLAGVKLQKRVKDFSDLTDAVNPCKSRPRRHRHDRSCLSVPTLYPSSLSGRGPYSSVVTMREKVRC